MSTKPERRPHCDQSAPANPARVLRARLRRPAAGYPASVSGFQVPEVQKALKGFDSAPDEAPGDTGLGPVMGLLDRTLGRPSAAEEPDLTSPRRRTRAPDRDVAPAEIPARVRAPNCSEALTRAQASLDADLGTGDKNWSTGLCRTANTANQRGRRTRKGGCRVGSDPPQAHDKCFSQYLMETTANVLPADWKNADESCGGSLPRTLHPSA
jgi:hypothetical protein